ncbi:MAG: TrkA family potassium uptake protein [Sulfurimicrobium sp.]|nr:TrkA family potassium uptake protein [Sulfurimicrobium sp.]MDP2199371.1 TrkA family potassium uptake protein [Sulfurimicrobium sp.]MDP3688112.1 TrkA family potassium uptake protein [Sulfurimicrobium sp.]
MRAVFIGAGAIAVVTARILLKRGHEVVIIERDKARIDAFSEELDCGFIHGDGGKPAILREADPEQTDFLFCLTGNDQSNIIASLVGRSLGFKRVVTRIEDPEFEHICIELGLKDTIVPNRTIGRHLADMFAGYDPLELSAMIKDEARVFSFVVKEEQAGPIDALDLPKDCRVICCYRDGKFTLPEPGDELRADDEVVVITHSRNVPDLEERWGPRKHRS